MIDPVGHPVMDLWEPLNPGYSDRKYPPVNGRWIEQKLIEFNDHQYLQWKLILNCEEWIDAPRGTNRKQGGVLNLLSGFYPKKDYDETNDREWTDIQEYALCIYTYFTADGKSVTLTIRAITCVWWKRIGDAGASLFMVYGEKMPFVQMVITGERLFARKGQGFSMVLSFSGNPFLEKEMIQEMS